MEDTKNENKEIEVIEKPYTFRRLNASDVFPMLKIVKKIGLNQFTGLLENENIQKMLNGKKSENEDDNLIMLGAVVFEIAQIIINGLGECEEEVFTLLSNVSKMPIKDIKELDFSIFIEMIVDFVKKEEFGDFMKVVSKFSKK